MNRFDFNIAFDSLEVVKVMFRFQNPIFANINSKEWLVILQDRVATS